MSKHVALQPVLGWHLLPMAIGAAIMLRCCWDFAWTGRGTPAPFDPPRQLVITGLYRRVRNPMYLGMGLFLIGEAFMLPPITREMLIMTVVLFVVVNVFIMAYEEPVLRSSFGEDYVRYTREVGRWVPRWPVRSLRLCWRFRLPLGRGAAPSSDLKRSSSRTRRASTNGNG